MDWEMDRQVCVASAAMRVLYQTIVVVKGAEPKVKDFDLPVGLGYDSRLLSFGSNQEN